LWVATRRLTALLVGQQSGWRTVCQPLVPPWTLGEEGTGHVEA
jgi:hypothetical protein